MWCSGRITNIFSCTVHTDISYKLSQEVQTVCCVLHRVKVRGHEEEGQIYPPLLVLKYGEITQEDSDSSAEVPFTFSVEYEMENSMSHAIEV